MSMRTYLKTGFAVTALAGAAFASAPAASASTPVAPERISLAQSGGPFTAQGGSCDSVGDNGYSWWANCRVNSGHARAITTCSDGTTKYGPWQGVGYWRFGGECAPHRLTGYYAQFVG
ncbi:hypothetical protein [Kribbella deserti]|uniref:Uncharacterized protein n=1 Tax=Kribbella deserti TaxID=1926257 RepID=A0ABV6QH57_9ACTN